MESEKDVEMWKTSTWPTKPSNQPLARKGGPCKCFLFSVFPSDNLSTIITDNQSLLYRVKMIYQQIAFVILALINHFALAITPVPVFQDEKVDGYVGYLSTAPTGDWLTSTYCYCAQPHHLHAAAADEGSFFQWEYYNYHRNATYIMQRQCEANHSERRTCVSSKRAQCEPESPDDCQGNMRCSYWPRSHTLEKKESSSGGGVTGDQAGDSWCMTIDDHWIYGTIDEITWNTQTRTLNGGDGQGRREQPEGDVLTLCEGLCQAQLGMPMLRGDKHARSRQEVFDRLDDMCESCRR